METTSRSKQQFCRCGHARSFTLQGLRHICRDPKCECVKHDTAVAPKRAKLALVEPASFNIGRRDAAVTLLQSALRRGMAFGTLPAIDGDIRAALVLLKEIS